MVSPKELAPVLALVSLAALVGCRRASPSPPTAKVTDTSPGSPAAVGEPCGPLECAQFESAADAMRVVLALDPRVVAIGEAHAQRGTTVDSAAKRFTREILPTFAGRASDLLVELMTPPEGCAAATVEVRERQAPATAPQAPTNQNEYLAMGERARSLGIVPDMLRPSCADMDSVRDAGDDAIAASLAMIARLSASQAGRLVDRDARSPVDRDKAVLVYGGMLHNDLAPEHPEWSYAPALDTRTGGRLVSVELVVPEFIGDDATWRGLAWRSHYDRARLGAKATLFRIADRSYVLVFPATASTEPAAKEPSTSSR